MIAGIDYSTGDGVICMDADLQHPVECIPQILDAFHLQKIPADEIILSPELLK